MIDDEITREEQYLAAIEREYNLLPKGYLTRSSARGRIYYYHTINERGHRTKLPIRPETNEGRSLLQQLIKKKQYLHDRPVLKRNLKFLKKATKELSAYDAPHLALPWETVDIENWKKENSRKTVSFPEGLIVPTQSGEMVRSKSEAAIYDELMKQDVIFIYESEIYLADGRCIRPDFFIVRKNDLKPFIWEHMGALDKKGKPARYLQRIQDLASIGFGTADNLIITWEDENSPFTAAKAKQTIDSKLIDGLSDLQQL